MKSFLLKQTGLPRSARNDGKRRVENREPFEYTHGLRRSRMGFTIVELLVVIIVIGILTAITIVSYSGITSRALEATVKSDLASAAKLMAMNYTENGVTATTFPSSVKTSSNIGLSLSNTGSSDTFCINGQTTNDTDIYYYYDSVIGAVRVGGCSGSVISGSELGMNKNLVKDDGFSMVNGSGWGIKMSPSGGVTVVARVGTSSDPIPNKPVLTFTNTTSKTVEWSYIRGQVFWGELLNANTYNASYYIRQYNGYIGIANGLNVSDGTGLNATITGDSITPTTSWKKVIKNSVALKSGTSGNMLYIGLPAAPFLATGWTLEIQAPRIVLQ